MYSETNSERITGSSQVRPGSKRFLLIMLILVIAAVSFIAGRYTAPKPYINQMGTDNGLSDPTNHRQGIPPDSLPH